MRRGPGAGARTQTYEDPISRKTFSKMFDKKKYQYIYVRVNTYGATSRARRVGTSAGVKPSDGFEVNSCSKERDAASRLAGWSLS